MLNALSKEARWMSGVTLITVPTIQFGGLTLLGVVTGQAAGLPFPTDLTATQADLYRAGHAHAGVLVILSLVIQVLLDSARLTKALEWASRIAAPLAAILISAGFFGLAHLPELRWMLYAGAACLAFSSVVSGVGLLRAPAVPR